MSTDSPDRRSLGSFYTPANAALLVAEQTFAALPSGPLRVLDPACGDGAFLLAAWDQLRQQIPSASLEEQCRWAGQCLFGVDIDPGAVAATQRRLLDEVLQGDSKSRWAAELRGQLERNIRCGDGLLDDPPGGAGFDAVLTNPPFINVRLQSQKFCAELRKEHRRRFSTARGAFDLFVLFLERSWQLLTDGGVCGAVVPNKLAVLDYAKPCRRLLAEQSDLLWIADVSRIALFHGASVYPLLFGFRKSPPSARPVRVFLIDRRESLRSDRLPAPAEVARNRLGAEPWQLHGELDVEARVPTTTMGELSTCHAGTAGFAAQQTAALIRETDELSEAAIAEGEWAEFVVSGSIRRYTLRTGDVRFMKRRWRRPLLNLADPSLSKRRRAMYRSPKIVVSGMSKRLAAAWDDRGRALGVQTYAATDLRAERLYLLALLNSTLLTRLFQLRFSGKRLASGYFSVNKSQLQQLPIRQPDNACPLQAEIIDLARRREQATDDQAEKLDEEIDRLVLELYRVEPEEIASCERC